MSLLQLPSFSWSCLVSCFVIASQSKRIHLKTLDFIMSTSNIFPDLFFGGSIMIIIISSHLTLSLLSCFLNNLQEQLVRRKFCKRVHLEEDLSEYHWDNEFNIKGWVNEVSCLACVATIFIFSAGKNLQFPKLFFLSVAVLLSLLLNSSNPMTDFLSMFPGIENIHCQTLRLLKSGKRLLFH